MLARVYCAARAFPMPSSIFGKLKTNFLGYSFLVVYLALANVIPITGADEVLHALGLFGVSMGLVFSYVSGASYLAAFARAYDRDDGETGPP
jgi:hypothetical protein